MKPNTELDTMMFFDDALENERTQLLTELADAVSETRTAVDQAAELNEDGEAGLLRLTEIWCAMSGIPAVIIFEGGQSELLANVVAQIYAHLLQHPFRDPVGLALYVELRYMTASLMLGEWFEYAAKETALQAEIDNIESSHPGYDEYRYDLDMIGHDPHELAAYLSAVLQGYTRQSAQAELERVFDAQYELTLTEEVEIRYRTETRTGTTTSTDPETGEVTTEEYEYEVEVPYEYYILNVRLDSKPISSVASELLTPEQLEMYQVYRQTLGNKPLVFGGGSPDMSNSEDLTGVVFVNGTRPGNQAVVDIAKSQVGNVGGQPYWSWYGFNSRVEWCACFVSWCYGQMGLSEPRFAACQSQGIPWFQSHGQWGGRDYANIAPGDAIFFDWDLDGSADHVGLVVGTDGSRVYTVEGNSGDACKIKSYSLTYECIKGYGLMNW